MPPAREDISRQVIVIDDDVAVRSSLQFLLKQTGYAVTTAEGPQEAMSQIREQPPDLAILDMNFSRRTTGEEGLKTLSELKDRFPQMPVILITAWGSIPLAVEGMKIGAADFITKPWTNAHLLQTIKTILSLSERSFIRPSASLDRQQLDDRWDFSGIVGRDTALLTVLEQAGRVAATDASVLIVGESGTGKECLAEAIHLNSHRRDGPFVKVNLGGIPASLFESEMFGHRRGAFTGAVRDRVGRFQAADGGTIFLDEIGDLDSSSQVKLLRVLQDRTFEALGSSETRSVDFRLVCATNCDLKKLVTNGRFREDLYYRINLITLELPPLHDRRSDIPLLIQFFTQNLREIYGRSELSLTPQAVQWLSDLPWPGNVRELKNLVERTILVTTHDQLDVSDFESQHKPVPRSGDTKSLPAVGSVTMDELEKSMIEKALTVHGKNLSKVARSLGLSRGALYRRLEKYDITT